MPGIPVIRFPGYQPAVGYTDFSRVFVSSSLSDREAAAVLKHERAHVYLQHLSRGKELGEALGGLNGRLWNIATDLEIAAHIYDEDDDAVITDPSTFLGSVGAISKAHAHQYPGCVYAEDFYEALLQRPPEGVESHDGDANDKMADPTASGDGAEQPRQEGQGQPSGGKGDNQPSEHGSGDKGDAGDGESGSDRPGSPGDGGGDGDADQQGSEAGADGGGKDRGPRSEAGDDPSDGSGGSGDGSSPTQSNRQGKRRGSRGTLPGKDREALRDLVEAAGKAVRDDAAIDAVQAAVKTAALQPAPSLAGVLDAALGRSKVVRERSYRRPARYENPDFLRKGYASQRKQPLVTIYVDRSGSFTPDKTAHAEAQLQRVLLKYKASTKQDVKYFSDEVTSTDPYRAHRGGGGTNYSAVWWDIHRDRPEVAVVITDDDPCPVLPRGDDFIPNVVVIHIGGGESRFGQQAGAKVFPA